MSISLTEQIICWLSPESCAICYSESESWCEACRQSSCPQPILRCYNCNKLTSQSMICRVCSQKSQLDELYYGGDYDRQLKRLISDYKFMGHRGLARSFARLLDERLPYLPADTLVTFVPTISSHVRMRGMDQAQRLAECLADERSLALRPMLKRLDQRQQRGQTRQTRLKQVASSFSPSRHAGNIKGATILLVDDVMTTGATLQAATKALKKSGAKHVIAAVVAHSSLKF